MLMSVVGAFVAYAGISAATEAPQKAVAVAMGLAFAVIPYCFSRAITEMRSNG